MFYILLVKNISLWGTVSINVHLLPINQAKFVFFCSRLHLSSDDNSNQSAAHATVDGAQSKAPQEKAKNFKGLGKKIREEKVVRKHLHVKAVLQGVVIGASILPSLKAQYKTDAITMTGVLGRKAHFTIMLPTHLLSFKSRVLFSYLHLRKLYEYSLSFTFIFCYSMGTYLGLKKNCNVEEIIPYSFYFPI